MTPTAPIAPPASDDTPNIQLGALPPLLGVVPVAGPAVFVYAGFGVVLLLLLVPPLALLATVAGVMLVVAAALVAIAALAVAMLEVPFLLVRLLRGRLLGHISLPVPHVREVKVRRA